MRSRFQERIFHRSPITDSYTAIDPREIEPQRDPVGPEKELLRQVLLRALQDATGDTYNASVSQCEREEALDWIFSDEDEPSDSDLPFVWICEHLDVCPFAVRIYINNKNEEGVMLGKVSRSVRGSLKESPQPIRED